MMAIVDENLYIMKAQDPTANLDILWKTSIPFRFSRPSWSGMMQFVQRGKHPGMSSIRFLPIVDMNPSDTTCIYSTLKFLAEHARRHNATPIVTFDQPLWWKALMIIDTEPVYSDLKNIVLRLGGFHLEMSFLRSIVHLMSASGLQYILELVYAPNAVVHMLTCKAIARALRAYLLVDAALNGLMLAGALRVLLGSQSNSKDEEADEAISEETAATVGTNRDLDETYALTHMNLSYLQKNSPFSSDTNLRSISTGVHACATVNVYKAEDVGRAILEDMEGKLWVSMCSRVQIKLSH